MLRTGLLFLFLFATTAVSAQVKVVVTDKEDNNPLSLVYVNLYSGDSLVSSVQTDDKGTATVYPTLYPATLQLVSQAHEQVNKLLTAAPKDNELKFTLGRKVGKLDEVVVTGTPQPVKMKDALSLYRVIDRNMIQAQGAVTLDDALKNQLNIRIGNDNILGSSVGMQGMSADKVKILIDGIPVNGREGGSINIGQLNMNNVERIEMIQGPMSVVYGTDALGGIINIITRKETKSLAAQVGTYYESVGKYNADATVNMRIDKHHSITLGGGRNFFAGWKYLDEPQTYNADTLRYSRNLLFKPKEQFIGNFAYNYIANSGFNLNLASDFLKETVTNRGKLQAWTPWDCYAFDEYYRTTRSMNRLNMGGKIGKSGIWQTQAGFSIYDRHRERVKKNMVTLTEIPTSGQGDQDTSSFKDAALRSSYTNNIGKLTYTAGYDINLQFATSTRISQGTKEIHDYAAYGNISLPMLKDRLTAQLGLRGAYNTVYAPPVIPSLNLLYKPVDKVQVRASYARGFRAPSLKEMYLSFIDMNHYVIGNVDLRAEYSNHMQLSSSWQAYQNNGDYLQFILTGFYNDVHDGIVLAPLNPTDTNSIEYSYRNITHQRNMITTAQADGQWSRFHFQLGYSYNYTFAEPGSFEAFTATEATVNVQYAWRKPGMTFNLFYKYVGTQPFLQPSIDGSAYYNGAQRAYSIFDGSVEKKFWDKRLHLIAGVKNIFNITQLRTSGVAATGTAHSGGAAGGFLPRSVFASLRLSVGN